LQHRADLERLKASLVVAKGQLKQTKALRNGIKDALQHARLADPRAHENEREIRAAQQKMAEQKEELAQKRVEKLRRKMIEQQERLAGRRERTALRDSQKCQRLEQQQGEQQEEEQKRQQYAQQRQQQQQQQQQQQNEEEGEHEDQEQGNAKAYQHAVGTETDASEKKENYSSDTDFGSDDDSSWYQDLFSTELKRIAGGNGSTGSSGSSAKGTGEGGGLPGSERHAARSCAEAGGMRVENNGSAYKTNTQTSAPLLQALSQM
jgi:hypothetical protein